MDGLFAASEWNIPAASDGSMSSKLAGFTIDRFGPEEMAYHHPILQGRYTAPSQRAATTPSRSRSALTFTGSCPNDRRRASTPFKTKAAAGEKLLPATVVKASEAVDAPRRARAYSPIWSPLPRAGKRSAFETKKAVRERTPDYTGGHRYHCPRSGGDFSRIATSRRRGLTSAVILFQAPPSTNRLRHQRAGGGRPHPVDAGRE